MCFRRLAASSHQLRANCLPFEHKVGFSTCQPADVGNLAQEEYVTAELVLATLLETARLGNSGPDTVAANARRRVDTPGGGGQIPGDTPWQAGSRGFGRTTPATANGHSAQQARATTGARPSRFQPGAETPRFAVHPSAGCRQDHQQQGFLQMPGSVPRLPTVALPHFSTHLPRGHARCEPESREICTCTGLQRRRLHSTFTLLGGSRQLQIHAFRTALAHVKLP